MSSTAPGLAGTIAAKNSTSTRAAPAHGAPPTVNLPLGERAVNPRSPTEPTASPSSATWTSPIPKENPTEDETKAEVQVFSALSLVGYRVYRQRWYGLVALTLINIVCAINWTLFTSISIDTAAHFAVSTTKVNWLSNIVCGAYVFAAPCVPWLTMRYSIRGVTLIAAALMLLGGWLRYAATASTLSPDGAYTLLFIGSFLIGVAQCFVQVIPPAFSETWFGLNARTTVTMILAVSNPFGGAIASLLAPGVVTNPSHLPLLCLIAAIIVTVCAPFAFLVQARPPTPPTKSAEGRLMSTAEVWRGVRALFGKGDQEGRCMTRRERCDFAIISIVFTVILAFFDAFLILINQIFEPYGYSSDQAGFIGAAVIFSGILAAGVSAPLLDRYFHFRLALTAKFLVPIIGLSFLLLIWIIKPSNLAPIFVITILMGCSSFTMLPIGLEMAAEIGYPNMGIEITSAVLYWLGNGASVVASVAMNALTSGPNASPPNNMRRAIVFEGIVVFVTSFLILFIKGDQTRRLEDVRAHEEMEERKGWVALGNGFGRDE
ncbi:BZ3500_MvSof-1268-A1-R1_Chr12-2g03864 [Microbotryum saponariae]|uniref:BZ3500_MvSof-1268-A1-R1_Chr12-2g03864 protein n=1 Tax=Microbotryum saponariae TaxID=289078 RepID=A0A2X0LTY2_9BASI|nr:BZ3500_MvSof-1268-A1-R1_Chr12-2g03864 [Microbotryum saponariae]SCZ99825.1 BZ3501_MvSof-1269-A2-R1_Chr12-2g03516 [Microbotryum saponariae]